MPRKCRNKGAYATWDEQNLKRAVRSVLVEGASKKTAAKLFNIPRSTLIRHVAVAASGGGVEKKLGRRTVLTPEQESDLASLILELEGRLYGLTPRDVCSLVFSFCKKNNIQCPFSENKRCAGRDWLVSFLERHKEISVRKPEAISIQKASGFNKAKVDKFYQLLENLMYDDQGILKIPPENIYNVDESGYTVVQKPSKVLGKKGKRNVGSVTSCERGRTITAVCCTSAVGSFVPPMLIFPRKKMRADLMDNAPGGAIGTCTQNGWINEEKFTEWFCHFLGFVQPKVRTNPVLLIMDGHSSHTRNLDVIDLARQNNVLLLCLPSHCTHRLQPLDVAFFKSLNSNYDEAVRLFLREKQRCVMESDIPMLFRRAYEKSACTQVAVNGFAKTGIFPFQPNNFTEEDFQGAAATDKPNPSDSHLTPGLDAACQTCSDSYYEPPVGCSMSDTDTGEVIQLTVEPVSSNVQSATADSLSVSAAHPESSVPETNAEVDIEPVLCSVATTNVLGHQQSGGDQSIEPCHSAQSTISLRDLVTVPTKLSTSRNAENSRKRKAGHATLITSSPYKTQLQASKDSIKDSKKQQPKKKRVQTKDAVRRKDINKHTKTAKKPSRKRINRDETNASTSHSAPPEREYRCIYCNDICEEPPPEPWSQCSVCLEWCHESCVPNLTAPFPANFSCQNCSAGRRRK